LLMTRRKQGSRDALRGIYEKYRDSLLILAIALSHDVNIAEDAVHDVFVAFAEHFADFELTGSLKGYLLTCVANRARNTNKAKQRQQNVVPNPAEPACSCANGPFQSIMYNEQLQQLSDAMTHLPYDQREAIMLHFQAEMTFKTIAKSLGISVNTVKSRYRYGLDKLREIFSNEAKK